MRGAIGSDIYPTMCKLGVSVALQVENGSGGWIFFLKANWEKYMEISDVYLGAVLEGCDIDEYEIRVRQGICMAAEVAIPKMSGKSKRKVVPGWNDKCEEAVKTRNRSFRILKRTHNFQHLIEYKKNYKQ